MTFSDWLNKTSMQSLRGFAIILVFVVVVFAFSVTAIAMFLSDSSAAGFRFAAEMVQRDTTKAVIDAAAALRAAAQTTETSHHNFGMQITTAIFTLIGIAMGVNVVGQGVDRFSSKELHRAKQEGQVAGVAAAAAAAKLVQDAKPQNGVFSTTHERPAINVENAERVIQEAGDGQLQRE